MVSKKPGPGPDAGGVRRLEGGVVGAVDHDSPTPGQVHREPAGQRGGLHSGNRGHAIQQLLQQTGLIGGLVHDVPRVGLDHRDAVHGIADALGPAGGHHLQRQAGPGQQEHRHGHLEHHERVLQAEPALAGPADLAVVAQRLPQLDPRRAQRRRQPEEDPGHERQRAARSRARGGRG